MVKIRDLTDKQLVSQLEKYEKIYDQLITEREKRAEKKGGYEGLMTEKEMEEFQSEEPEANESTQAFQLKFEDSEIQQMNDAEKESKQARPEDEEVRVTQLLKLSSEQMAELRDNAKKTKKVTKKVMKKKKQK